MQVITTQKEPEKSGNISKKQLSQVIPREGSLSDSFLRKAVDRLPDMPGCCGDEVTHRKNLPGRLWTKVTILKKHSPLDPKRTERGVHYPCSFLEE